jgi:hypothetical protein
VDGSAKKPPLPGPTPHSFSTGQAEKERQKAAMLNAPSCAGIHSLFSLRTAPDWNLEITEYQVQMIINEVHGLQNITELTARCLHNGQVQRVAEEAEFHSIFPPPTS